MNKKQLRILIAPLDWGMGHTTRCMPIISFLFQEGHQVIFAGNPSQQRHVRSTFPDIDCVDLEGYNVQYAKSKFAFIPKIVLQIPRIKRCIKKEQLWLQNQIESKKIDAVISDNRYGLYAHKIPCIFITHQLGILSGFGRHADKILLKIHYKLIEKFSTCWVVDVQGDDGVSGSLAHPYYLPKIETTYIGLLSQCLAQSQNLSVEEEEDYVLILLSGAEPQRSQLANLLWKKAIKSDKKIIFVAGSNRAIIPEKVPPHISYHQKLSATDVNIAIKASTMVICRSGYSSLMDLIALKKKAVLIPTPGQTEQEYLAKRMHQKKYFLVANQAKFDLQTSLLNATVFSFSENDFELAFYQHEQVLKNWLQKL